MMKFEYFEREAPITRVDAIVVYGNIPYTKIHGTTTDKVIFRMPKAWPNWGAYVMGWNRSDLQTFVVEPPAMDSRINGGVNGTVIMTSDITGGVHEGKVDLWKGLTLQIFLPSGKVIPIKEHPGHY